MCPGRKENKRVQAVLSVGRWRARPRSADSTRSEADMPVCLCGTFAPLCLACRISDDFGECCCTPYLPGGLHSLRTGMRERYRIQGSVGKDWAALTFCLPCALCQMARELKIRE